MKLVTFGRDMRPHTAGDTRLVPDDIAEELMANGDISASVPYPPLPEPERAEVTKPRPFMRPNPPHATKPMPVQGRKSR